ncbi:MAG TPA: phage portal protein, partial [Thermoplasmata archaeon]|nr:phage portal protein [Thermoplasmata archaeon]
DKSPLLRMVHWAIVRECTRKTIAGLRRFWDFFPAFKLKCTECGAEYQEVIEKCRCGSTTFREPNPEQLNEIMALLKSPNPDASWGDITKKNLYDAQVSDDWFISIGYDYKHERPVALYYEDPRTITIIADDRGMLGNGEYFCPTHTKANPNIHYTKRQGTCPVVETIQGVRTVCGCALVETAYMQEIDGALTARWARHEMIHGNNYSVGTRLTGNTPMRSLIIAVLTHLAIDNYNFDAFKNQRSPDSALVFTNTAQEEVDKAAENFAERQKENMYEQLWLGMPEGQGLEYVKMLDSVLNSGMGEQLEWVRSLVCSVYGVTSEFVAVETPGRLGNANEVQIHVQNNTTEANQDQFAEQINRDLLPLFSVTDWYWDFVPVEPEDERMQADILLVNMQAAEAATRAGLDVVVENGEVYISGTGSRPEMTGVAMSLDGKWSPVLGKSENRPEEGVRGAVTDERKFEEQILADYDEALKRALKGLSRSTSPEDLKAAIDRELSALERKLGRKARAFIEEVYMRGLQQAASDMKVTMKKAEDLTITFDALDQEAIDYIMNDWHGVSTTLPDFVRSQKEAFARIIAEAYKDPKKFTLRALRQAMQEFSNAERYKLERIALTETTLISNTARMNGYLKDPDNKNAKYNWSVAGTACPICNAIASGGPYTYEKLKEVTKNFVPHPHCRCTPTLHVEGA